jgi:biopolymer transport protein ExbD
MAKTKGYDVWLTASNRVYRGVPYDKVADWLQEGRIVGGDRVRPEGGGNWDLVSASPLFATYLPRPSAQATAEDRAEALEPVGFDLSPSRRPLDEDEDVDMIPLIDISLVLLIFFMMTTTVAVSGADVPTPTVHYGVGLMASDPSVFWVGIDRGDGGKAIYSMGQGDRPPQDNDRNLTQEQVLARLDAKINEASGSAFGISVRVAAHKQTPFGTVQALTAELEKRRGPGRIAEIKAEMNEKSQ